jgi:hypothetical protein
MCVVCVVVLLRVQDKNDEWFTTNHFFFISNFFTHVAKNKKIDSPSLEEEGILPHHIPIIIITKMATTTN